MIFLVQFFYFKEWVVYKCLVVYKFLKLRVAWKVALWMLLIVNWATEVFCQVFSAIYFRYDLLYAFVMPISDAVFFLKHPAQTASVYGTIVTRRCIFSFIRYRLLKLNTYIFGFQIIAESLWSGSSIQTVRYGSSNKSD